MTDPSPLHITHVTAPAAFGGLESVMSLLATGLSGRGHRVRVIALVGDEPSSGFVPFQGFEAAGVDLVWVRLPPRSYLAERHRIETLLGDTRGGVVHSHGYHADLVGLWAARRAGRPIASTVHGYTGRGLKNRFYEYLDYWALRRFDAVVPVSRPLQQLLADTGVPADRLVLIPNAYEARHGFLKRAEARRSLGLPEDGPVVGWVGRLTEEKGPEQFLEALARCSRPVLGSVVGTGPLRLELEDRARTLGIADRLRWHGVVPNAGHRLAAFDALVLSSRTEGTPMVVLEAMAAGIPLVVTAVGGIPDIVSGTEAVLVPAGDPASLARGVDQIFAAPELALERARLARKRLETSFGVEPWLDRYEDLYRRLAARRT